jgi:hypothetical protein
MLAKIIAGDEQMTRIQIDPPMNLAPNYFKIDLFWFIISDHLHFVPAATTCSRLGDARGIRASRPGREPA